MSATPAGATPAGSTRGGSTRETWRFSPRVFRLDQELGVDELLRCLWRRRGLVALDSASGAPQRFSWVAFDPIAAGETPCTLPDLARWIDRFELCAGDEIPGPFWGGFIGALSYDLGVQGERWELPRDPWSVPPIVGGLYTDFIVRDESSRASWLVLGEAPGDERAPLAARRVSVLRALARPPAPLDPARPIGRLLRCTPPEEHQRRIGDVRARIAEGEIYQANLAHRFTRAMAGHPLDLYLRLRAINPAPYMAYLTWAHSGAALPSEGAILSASPELLLEFDGRTARTRPIKGTAPRGATRVSDVESANALLESAKDRAELAMIVDLERNDLGRVAEIGSVRVEGFPRLASFANVHHLVADVVAHPRTDVKALDLLAALFPGGSITGAPKLASMRVIAEVEGEGRGFFTGSLGYVDARGRCCFNILIRTLIWRAGPRVGARRATPKSEVSFHVGSGITWSSDAEAEDRETCLKGALLQAALEAPVQAPAREPVRVRAARRRS